jgi:hypothetical protein
MTEKKRVIIAVTARNIGNDSIPKILEIQFFIDTIQSKLRNLFYVRDTNNPRGKTAGD